MMIAKVKFGYGKKYSPEVQEKAKAAILMGQLTFDEDGSVKEWFNEFIVDLDLLPINELAPVELINVVKEKPIDELKYRDATQINQKVNVAVPNLGLLNVTEVQVIEDCCTVTLQGYLNNGWMILAICPQPDQRRPDYVVGRKGSNEETF